MKHEDVSKLVPAAASVVESREAVQNTAANAVETATDAIVDALRKFSSKIGETIINGKREGLLRPTDEVYTRYPIDERSIEQTDYGLKRRNYALEEIVKESWFHATRAVVWRLQESDIYANLVKMFDGTALDAERAKRLVDSFAHRISYRFLETGDETQRSEFLSSQLEAVRKHLGEERFKHSSEVRLVGLAGPPTLTALRTR